MTKISFRKIKITRLNNLGMQRIVGGDFEEIQVSEKYQSRTPPCNTEFTHECPDWLG